MNIRQYINNKNADEREDFESHVFENVWREFTLHLPTTADMEDDDCNSIDIWYSESADEILCRSEELADMIANIIEGISGEHEAHTGYYDPDEDVLSGEVDEYTGWYYVDYD
jgi:hypothetical protein